MATLDFNAASVKPFKPVEIDDVPRDTSTKWSKYQEAIFNFVEFGVGNALVEAVAGSGKTSTIVEATKRVKGSSLFLAFNKSIATELANRGLNARTFHALTYSAVCQFVGAKSVTQDKMRILCKENLSSNDNWNYSSCLIKLVGLAKQSGFGCLVAETEEEWLKLAEHHDIEPDGVDSSVGRMIELASDLLVWSNQSAMVDFDDLLYLSVLRNVSLQKYDFVFVDEAQDTNAIQRAILKKVMNEDARLVAVGDPAQAIYGFRGADSNSLDLIASEFNCIRLPLSISYRCAKAIVRHASKWVSHIEASETAAEGEVLVTKDDWNNKIFKPLDLVVCRTTAPLISLAFSLLKDRIAVTVLGREIGTNLKVSIKKLKATSLESLSKKLTMRLSVDLANAGDDAAKAEAFQDKHDTIQCLIDSMGDGESIDDLLNLIDKLFADKQNSVMLSTIHKSKGLEADTVFWLNSSKCPAKWADKEWQRKQEINLCYVATTRAKSTLVLIES